MYIFGGHFLSEYDITGLILKSKYTSSVLIKGYNIDLTGHAYTEIITTYTCPGWSLHNIGNYKHSYCIAQRHDRLLIVFLSFPF